MNSSSKIIKAENIKLVKRAKEAGARVFTRDRFDSEKKATFPLSADAAPAAAARDDAAAKISAREEERYQQGFLAGLGKGKELQKEEFARAVAALNESMKRFDRSRQDLLEKAEGQILDLAFSLTEKILHQEVTTNRAVIQGVLREAIRNILDRDGIKVRLNPQDFQFMMETKHDFLQSLDGIKDMVFEEDPSVRRGGALLETTSGEVDARLNQQLGELKTALLNK